MRVVRGRTMAEALGSRPSLAKRLELLHHYVDLCEAVAYAHSRGVIHRDLKPENVMLGEFGETVVLDWGLAKVAGKKDLRGAELERDLRLLQGPGTGKTVDGTAIGTPAYMSPEQADGAVDDIDERSDVWSLGAVLYELLTGRPPFEGVTPFEIIGNVLKDAVRPPREVDSAIPAELAAVASKALSRDKAMRYGRAGELAAEIRAYMSGGRIQAYDYSAWELLKGVVSRHRAVSALVALVLVLVLGGSAVLLRAYRRADQERARATENESRAVRGEIRARLELALGLRDKAMLQLEGGNLLGARIFAAASLQENPASPKGKHRGDLAPAEQQRADEACGPRSRPLPDLAPCSSILGRCAPLRS
jgi:serine/threonine-protein kinase